MNSVLFWDCNHFFYLRCKIVGEEVGRLCTMEEIQIFMYWFVCYHLKNQHMSTVRQNSVVIF
jgi:hypothetical protein